MDLYGPLSGHMGLALVVTNFTYVSSVCVCVGIFLPCVDSFNASLRLSSSIVGRVFHLTTLMGKGAGRIWTGRFSGSDCVLCISRVSGVLGL